MLKIGVQTRNVIRDDDPVAGFRMIREAGFDCVDFALQDHVSLGKQNKFKINHFLDRSAQELEEFFKPYRDGAAAEGVEVGQMHMPYPLFVPKADETVNRYLAETVAPRSLELCAYFGCRHIVVHGFKLAWELGSETAEWEQTEKFLLSVAPLAKELGVILCIENLFSRVGRRLVDGPCCDARLTVERIDRLNDKMGGEVFGFCFDTGHANVLGLDFEDYITIMGGRLKVLHIHDNDGVEDLHQIPFVFTTGGGKPSATDWDGFIRGLKRIGFDGVLSFETGSVLRAFPPELKPAALTFIHKIGRYFATQIERENAPFPTGGRSVGI